MVFCFFVSEFGVPQIILQYGKVIITDNFILLPRPVVVALTKRGGGDGAGEQNTIAMMALPFLVT